MLFVGMGGTFLNKRGTWIHQWMWSEHQPSMKVKICKHGSANDHSNISKAEDHHLISLTLTHLHTWLSTPCSTEASPTESYKSSNLLRLFTYRLDTKAEGSTWFRLFRICCYRHVGPKHRVQWFNGNSFKILNCLHPNTKILLLLIFLLFLLLSSLPGITQKVYSVWKLNIPNDCSANLLHSYLFWASDELQVASYGLKMS